MTSSTKSTKTTKSRKSSEKIDPRVQSMLPYLKLKNSSNVAYLVNRNYQTKGYATLSEAMISAYWTAQPFTTVYILKANKIPKILYIVTYEAYNRRILMDAQGNTLKLLEFDKSGKKLLKKTPVEYYIQARGYSDGPFKSLTDAKKAARKLSGDSMWDYEYSLDYVTVGIYKNKTLIGSVYADKYTPAKSK